MEGGWTTLDTVKSRAPTTHGRVVGIAAAALRGLGNGVGSVRLEAAPPNPCHDHAAEQVTAVLALGVAKELYLGPSACFVWVWW
jgi:hypothetical protein